MGNASIVGFFGRSGHVVDAIGLYVNLARGPMEKQDLITKVDLWGGNSGQAHDLDVVPRRLISVVVLSGEVIDSLKFTYSDCDGHQHTAGPWGGSDASQSMNNHMILLGRSEVVKEVSGTIGPNSSVPDFVSSLLLATNTSSHGPFGEGRGIPFRIPLQDNDSIVGFFAQAEKHINAIGFYLESMEIKVLLLFILLAAAMMLLVHFFMFDFFCRNFFLFEPSLIHVHLSFFWMSVARLWLQKLLLPLFHNSYYGWSETNYDKIYGTINSDKMYGTEGVVCSGSK
ncbi:mannose/glucose-specific lectin-like isoform X2 [Triticum urartu]|nr:mannose/glucose-specific lectin-like isoform X2 [Triticum urartu]